MITNSINSPFQVYSTPLSEKNAAVTTGKCILALSLLTSSVALGVNIAETALIYGKCQFLPEGNALINAHGIITIGFPLQVIPLVTTSLATALLPWPATMSVNKCIVGVMPLAGMLHLLSAMSLTSSCVTSEELSDCYDYFNASTLTMFLVIVPAVMFLYFQHKKTQFRAPPIIIYN